MARRRPVEALLCGVNCYSLRGACCSMFAPPSNRLHHLACEHCENQIWVLMSINDRPLAWSPSALQHCPASTVRMCNSACCLQRCG